MPGTTIMMKRWGGHTRAEERATATNMYGQRRRATAAERDSEESTIRREGARHTQTHTHTAPKPVQFYSFTHLLRSNRGGGSERSRWGEDCLQAAHIPIHIYIYSLFHSHSPIREGYELTGTGAPGAVITTASTAASACAHTHTHTPT